MGRYWSTRRGNSIGHGVAVPVNSLGIPLQDLGLLQEGPGAALAVEWTPLIETAPCRVYLYFNSLAGAFIEFSELIDVNASSWLFGQGGEDGQVWYVKVVTTGYDDVVAGPYVSI